MDYILLLCQNIDKIRIFKILMIEIISVHNELLYDVVILN